MKLQLLLLNQSVFVINLFFATLNIGPHTAMGQSELGSDVGVRPVPVVIVSLLATAIQVMEDMNYGAVLEARWGLKKI